MRSIYTEQNSRKKESRTFSSLFILCDTIYYTRRRQDDVKCILFCISCMHAKIKEKDRKRREMIKEKDERL